MILVSSCSCLCLINWSRVLSWEWRCVGYAPTTSEGSTILLPTKVHLILETWRYMIFKYFHSRRGFWKCCYYIQGPIIKCITKSHLPSKANKKQCINYWIAEIKFSQPCQRYDKMYNVLKNHDVFYHSLIYHLSCSESNVAVASVNLCTD